mgnify:CR=1 FL=1
MTKQEDPDQKARAVALRLLARREHSRLELGQKLRQRKFDSFLIDQVLNEYEANNWLSDERFADVFATQRFDQGQGPLKITAELQKRGIQSPPHWFLARTREQWVERAVQVRDRRFGLEDIREDWQEKGRQGRFLASRGFTTEQVEAALQVSLRSDQSVGGR